MKVPSSLRPFLSTLATLLTNAPPFQILQTLLVTITAAATVVANPIIPGSSGTNGDFTPLSGIYSCSTKKFRRSALISGRPTVTITGRRGT